MRLFVEYLFCSELCFNRALYLESISEEYISFLCEDREYELVIILETVREVIDRHDRIFHLFSIKCLLEKVVELDLVEIPDDKNIDDIVRGFISKIQYCIRDRHEIEGFASLEELFHRLHDII